MNKFSNAILCLLGILYLSSCALNQREPLTTLKNQTEGFHQTIEDTTKALHSSENYQSLSFGQLKIYKPAAFIRLDSIYNIKQEYLDNNDLRGLKRSGIEELIPGYKAEAQQELDKVEYEIEHIYQTSTEDSIQIHHTYFQFDYKDSLLLITPFYNFKIDKKYKDLYYDYQFEYHFVTDRDLYISEAEWQFIRFFKTQEIQLIGEPELQDFMNHTLHIMETAKEIATIDFRNVSKHLAIDYFKDLKKDITIEKFSKLIALEQNDRVIGYELEVDWTKEDAPENQLQRTTFSFSPYLELRSKTTQKK